MNPTVKKILLQLCGYCLSIAPVAVVVGLRWDTYTATTASTISLSVSGALALIIILLKALNKMPKNVKPIVWEAAALVMVLAIEPILLDLKYLLTAVLVGDALEMGIIEWQVTKVKRVISQGATLDAMDTQTKAIVDALKGIDGKGRV